MTRLSKLTLTGLVLLMMASGCGKREDAVTAANRNGIFLMSNGAEPRDLDPHVVTDMPENRVIKALSLALDRAAIIDKVTKNGQPARGFVPPHIPGYPAADALGHDPEMARQLLAEAGYSDGVGFPALEFLITNSDTSRIFAEVVQEMWRNELGIKITILNKEWQVLISDMDNGHFDIFLLSWIGDYLDPATFLKIMRSGDGNNRTGYANPNFDTLVARANQQAVLVNRYSLLSQAESILLRDVPILPVTWARNMYLLKESVQGWAPKPLMDQPYKAVRLVPGD